MTIKFKVPFIGLNQKFQNEMNNPVTQIIIRREACIYGCLNFNGTKKSLLKSSLNLQLKRLSPFLKYDSYIIWKNDHAMFWLWQSLTTNDEQPLPQSVKVIPESLFCGGIEQSKIEIIQLENGFEARYWDADLLRGTQYWPQKPSLVEWNNFLRNHSQTSQQQLPQILPHQQNEIPWYQPTYAEKILDKAKTFNFPVIVATVFIIFVSYQFASLVHISQKLENVRIEHDLAMEKSSDIVTARNNAVHELTIIQQINEISKWPTQIELLAVCNQLLSELDASLLSWKFDNGEILLVSKTNNIDSTAFVASFENSGLFSSVNLNTQAIKGNLSLQLVLKPLAGKLDAGQSGVAL